MWVPEPWVQPVPIPIARKELCSELVILDIKEGIAEGKALGHDADSHVVGFDTKITAAPTTILKLREVILVVITLVATQTRYDP